MVRGGGGGGGWDAKLRWPLERHSSLMAHLSSTLFSSSSSPPPLSSPILSSSLLYPSILHYHLYSSFHHHFYSSSCSISQVPWPSFFPSPSVLLTFLVLPLIPAFSSSFVFYSSFFYTLSFNVIFLPFSLISSTSFSLSLSLILYPPMVFLPSLSFLSLLALRYCHLQTPFSDPLWFNPRLFSRCNPLSTNPSLTTTALPPPHYTNLNPFSLVSVILSFSKYMILSPYNIHIPWSPLKPISSYLPTAWHYFLLLLFSSLSPLFHSHPSISSLTCFFVFYPLSSSSPLSSSLSFTHPFLLRSARHPFLPLIHSSPPPTLPFPLLNLPPPLPSPTLIGPFLPLFTRHIWFLSPFGSFISPLIYIDSIYSLIFFLYVSAFPFLTRLLSFSSYFVSFFIFPPPPCRCSVFLPLLLSPSLSSILYDSSSHHFTIFFFIFFSFYSFSS